MGLDIRTKFLCSDAAAVRKWVTQEQLEGISWYLRCQIKFGYFGKSFLDSEWSNLRQQKREEGFNNQKRRKKTQFAIIVSLDVTVNKRQLTRLFFLIVLLRLSPPPCGDSMSALSWKLVQKMGSREDCLAAAHTHDPGVYRDQLTSSQCSMKSLNVFYVFRAFSFASLTILHLKFTDWQFIYIINLLFFWVTSNIITVTSISCANY